jgi:phytoene dehydrogenase-like protein
VSTATHDVIVVGGGPDALVAATLLARAGRRVQVIVEEDTAAGSSRAFEFAPGYAARLNLEADWVPDAVLRALRLSVSFDAPKIPASVALPDGGFLPLSRHMGDASAAIRELSPRDATQWPAFMTTMHQLAGFLEALYLTPPPDLDTTSLGDLPSLLSLGHSFRSLGKTNMTELLRVIPMPAQDLVDEWFTFEPLKAVVASAAVRDIRQGPRSGGTSFVLLHYLTGVDDGSLRGRPWRPHGEDGGDSLIALAEQAARGSGVEIRTNTKVERISIAGEAVTGIVLRGGDEIMAPTVLSTMDPARTFLGLIDPVWLDPEFLLAVRNIKFRGSTALVCFALDTLPFDPGSAPTRLLSGIMSLSSTVDAIEKAYDATKYGAMAEQLHIEITMPSIVQTGASGKHVLVAKVQYVPRTLRDGSWDAARSKALGDRVAAAISRVIPRFADVVRERVVLTPADIEARFSATDGALTQGEITLDQILFMRPVAGWGQYAMPIRGLYLGGAGTHPGPGVFGISGLLAARRMIADSRTQR